MENPQALDEAAAALHQVVQAGKLSCMGNSSKTTPAQLFEQVFRIAASGNSQFVQLDDKIGTVDTSEGSAQHIVGGKSDSNRSDEETEPDVNKYGCGSQVH